MKTNIAIICLASLVTMVISTQANAKALSEDQLQFCNAQAEYTQQSYLSRSAGVSKHEALDIIAKSKHNPQAERVATDILNAVYQMTMPTDKTEVRDRAIGAGNGMMIICIKSLGGE